MVGNFRKLLSLWLLASFLSARHNIALWREKGGGGGDVRWRSGRVGGYLG